MMLFLAEKPSLGKVLAQSLGGVASRGDGSFTTGSGDRVTWCFGHLFEQANPEDYDANLKDWRMDTLPIMPDVWQLKPSSLTAGMVCLCCHHPAYAGAAHSRRRAVALARPFRSGWCSDYESILHSRLGRKARRERARRSRGVSHAPVETAGRRADRLALPVVNDKEKLMGMNLTRACTITGRAAGYDGVLSVGRVQTPTLALVVQRDLAIEKFQSIPFYGVTIDWDAGFSSQWQPSEDISDSDGRCLDRSIADGVVTKVKGQTGIVQKAQYQQKKSAPPLPFSLSALQSEASKRYGMGAQAVLDTAQALYEKHKLTSYPRTDCGYLAEGQHSDAGKILSALAGMDSALSGLVTGADTGLKSSAFNDKKITAHTGIIPTGQAIDLAVLNDNERKVFELIARRYVMQFYAPAVFNEAKITITIADETFTSSGKVLVDAGWRVCLEKTDADTELPQVTEGQSLNCVAAKREDKKTTPPERFSEGALIKAMAGIAKLVENPKLKAMLKETSGIGTEATRAGIIETLKKRGFIVPKGKALISTDAGRGLITALPEDITSAEITALWELWLDDIATGKMSLAKFMQKQISFVEKQVNGLKSGTSSMAALTSSMPDCPKCKASKLKLITAKATGKKFWVCASGREVCEAIYSDKKGKPDLSKKRKGKKKAHA